jgi:outer membrane protein TolC
MFSLFVNQPFSAAASAYHTAVSDLVFAARKASNQLKLLDEQYKAKELDQQKAVEQYKSTLVLYQTGGATMYAVLQTQAAILSAEAALKQNRITYSSALYTLEHTELSGSASASSDEKK